jgi:hypothetical protein
VANHERPRSESPENRLQRLVTWQLNECRNCRWSDALESLFSEEQSLWKMTKRVMRVPTPSPHLQMPGGLVLSDSEKVEALADSLESQFQPLDNRRTRPSLRYLIWRCVHTSMRPQVNRH